MHIKIRMIFVSDSFEWDPWDLYKQCHDRHKLQCHTSHHGRHNGPAGQSLGWRDPRAVDSCTDAEGFKGMDEKTHTLNQVFLGSDKSSNRLEQFLQSKAGRINAAWFGLVEGCWRSCLNWWDFVFFFWFSSSKYIFAIICRARVIQSPFAMSSSWEWESLARICCKTEGCCDACIEHCAGRVSWSKPIVSHLICLRWQSIFDWNPDEWCMMNPESSLGEPLENYDAVSSAIRGLVDPARFALAPSSVYLCFAAKSMKGRSPVTLNLLVQSLWIKPLWVSTKEERNTE